MNKDYLRILLKGMKIEIKQQQKLSVFHFLTFPAASNITRRHIKSDILPLHDLQVHKKLLTLPEQHSLEWQQRKATAKYAK